jgi:hypothetical protein
MVGCVQGLIGSLKTASAPPPVSGKRCTSAQVSLACCTSTGICAAADFGLGVTCSPVDAQGPSTWTYDC